MPLVATQLALVRSGRGAGPSLAMGRALRTCLVALALGWTHDPLLTWCSAVTGPLGHGVEPGTQGFTIDRPDRHLMVRHHLETLQTVTAG